MTKRVNTTDKIFMHDYKGTMVNFETFMSTTYNIRYGFIGDDGNHYTISGACHADMNIWMDASGMPDGVKPVHYFSVILPSSRSHIVQNTYRFSPSKADEEYIKYLFSEESPWYFLFCDKEVQFYYSNKFSIPYAFSMDIDMDTNIQALTNLSIAARQAGEHYESTDRFVELVGKGVNKRLAHYLATYLTKKDDCYQPNIFNKGHCCFNHNNDLRIIYNRKPILRSVTMQDLFTPNNIMWGKIESLSSQLQKYLVDDKEKEMNKVIFKGIFAKHINLTDQTTMLGDIYDDDDMEDFPDDDEEVDYRPITYMDREYGEKYVQLTLDNIVKAATRIEKESKVQ